MRRLFASAFTVALIALAVSAATASAATCTWSGMGVDNNWQTVANWSNCGGTVPGSADDVVISSGPGSGLPDVTSADASVRSISLSGTGGFTVEASRTLAISTNGSSTFVGGHTTVNGTLTVGDSSTWAGGGGYVGSGTIRIGSSGVMTIDPGSMGIVELVPKLDNDGTAPGAGVEVKTGTLQLDHGDAGSTAGPYAIDFGATLKILSGAFEAPSVTGAGTFALVGTVTVGSSDIFTPATLRMESGTFTLNKDDSIANLVVPQFGGGMRNGTGTLTITASTDFSDEIQFTGGTTTIAKTVPPVMFGAGQLLLSNATLNLDTPTTWSGNQWTIQNGSTLNVNSSLDIPSLSGGLGNGGGAASILHVGSGGSITSNPGAGREMDWDFSDVHNDGTVTVQSGTLAVNGASYIQAGGTTSVASGAALNGPVTLSGGTLNGNGTLGGPVTNSGGTVAPGASPGTLTITGSYTQGAGGKLAEDIAGTTPGTQFDRLVVGGALMLGGTLAINSTGFTPSSTDTFKIISGAGSRTGTFASVTGAVAGPEMYVPQYDTDGVTLTVTAAPTPPPPTNTTPPSISGIPVAGHTLTCSKGAWTHTPTHFIYRWKRNGKGIRGATHRTYVVQSADQGHTLTCTVVASNAGGPSTATTSRGLAVSAPPKCRLTSKRRVTITFRKIAGKKTISGGILPVQITCNQKVATKLTATLTDHPGGGAAKHYRLTAINKRVRKGSRTVVKLKLPAVPVTDLVHGATESVTAALAAHGRAATSRVRATFSPLTR